MVRVVGLIGIIGLLVALGFPASDRQPQPGNHNGVAFAQGNSGENPMREMMRRMMQGLVPPPGMTPERLPDAGSEGARLLVRYCEQCHDLPSPQYKSAPQWPSVLDRMLGRMQMMGGGMTGGGMMGGGMMGMGRIEAPTTSEARTLLGYLQTHAIIEARSNELAAGDPADRRVFSVTCAQCHVLPSPSLHAQQEWPAVVVRMEGNMRLMGKPGIAANERDAIVRFLQSASVKTH
jgi:cytochrome c2